MEFRLIKDEKSMGFRVDYNSEEEGACLMVLSLIVIAVTTGLLVHFF